MICIFVLRTFADGIAPPAMMQAQFEHGVAISAKKPESKVSSDVPAASDGKKKKRVVHVQKSGPGVPEGFWDPVVPKSGEGSS